MIRNIPVNMITCTYYVLTASQFAICSILQVTDRVSKHGIIFNQEIKSKSIQKRIYIVPRIAGESEVQTLITILANLLFPCICNAHLNDLMFKQLRKK